ncbi:MAG: twin-arginine translocation signal domain-containing protein [Fibrobacter sp.]|nr:twin-arginine translocation signal domain-containing protein [Fibrobacter sp.]
MVHNKIITRRNFLKLATLSCGAGLIGSYSFFFERNKLQINTYRIPIPNLPESFEGFTIAHISDIHYGFYFTLDHVKEIVKTANSLSSDLIVCTGDYIYRNYSDKPIDTVWPVLSLLQARHGVFSVLGNHDYWGRSKRSIYWLEKSGQSLHFKAKPVIRNGEALWFIGIGDLWEDYANVDHILSKSPPDSCRILLVHNPDTADMIYSSRADLVIAGHTHGGQVKFPFIGSPILPVYNKKYSSGLKYTASNIPVFITRGIGCSNLPIRFNCYPEIAVLKLTRANIL